MAKTRKRAYLRTGLAVVMALALFASLMIGLFRLYSARINGLFDSLTKDDLLLSTQSQAREADSMIQEVRGTMEAIAAIYTTSDISPSSVWSRAYLSALSEGQKRYEVEYVKMEDLREGMAGLDAQGIDQAALDRLMAGEAVVSDVYGAQPPSRESLFCVVVPVIQDGRVTGVLRSTLQARDLAGKAAGIDGYLVQKDGRMVLTEETLAGGFNDLFERMARENAAPETVQALRRAMREGENYTGRMGDYRGYAVFASATPLMYNDWRLVSFARVYEISDYPAAILRDTAVLSGCVALLVISLIGIGLLLINRLRRKMRRDQERYAILSRFSDTILFEYDYKAEILEMTPNVRERFPGVNPRSRDALSEGRLREMLHPDDVQRVLAFRDGVGDMAEGEVREIELRIRDSEESHRWVLCQCQLVRSRKGMPRMLFGKLSDVNAQKEKERALIQQSTRDPLTGALNKEAMQAHVDAALALGEPGFLFMIDVDNFKQINDQWGHPQGDQVLSAFAKTLSGGFRAGDLVGRAGGDEFVVFMHGVADARAAQARAGRILRALASLSGEKERLSVSIGIAQAPEDGACYLSLYQAADEAMYQAKRAGKGRYQMVER